MATKFKIEHVFKNISLEKFVTYLNDPKLNQMLLEGLQFKERTLIKRKEDKDKIEWVFTVKKAADLPAPIKKIIKEDSLTWQETSRFLKKENCIYWEIDPLQKMFRFHGEGTWRLMPSGKDLKRIIDGEISVEIPLVGKMVESFIVNELLKNYEIEPLIQEKFYTSVF